MVVVVVVVVVVVFQILSILNLVVKEMYVGPKPAVCWAEARLKIARMTLTIKLDGNWSSFQLANSAPPLSVTDSAIAPSARIQGMVNANPTSR